MPPSGVSAALPAIRSSSTSREFVLLSPFSSMTHPPGRSFPSLAYSSTFPLWVIDVAQSRRNGKGSSVGMANVRGFVPSMFSTPKVGAIEGRALVPVMPIMFSRTAIRG